VETSPPQPDTSAGSVAGAPDAGSFFSNLLDLFFEPRAAFARIMARPSVWPAIAGQTAISVGFFAIWIQKVEPRVFFRNLMAENPQTARMPAERIEAMISDQARLLPTFGWIQVTLAPLLLTLVASAVLLFVFRFFLAADVTFKKTWTAVSWSFLATSLVTSPLILLVMWLKEDWNLNPQEAVQANPTAFFEPGTIGPAMTTFLGSFDLFSFWLVFLLGAGMTAAARARSNAASLWAVGSLWGLYVLIRVGWSLLFSD
jgi:hypothetical protein